MKGVLSCLLALLCSSCATIKTIDPPTNHVKIAYKGKKSYCSKIPRIYSGTAYNACLLYGEPSKVNTMDSINGIPFFLIDSAFSVVTDTAVLPYTIFTQVNKGNLLVN